MRVVDEVESWDPHPPEVLQGMLDSIAKLRADGHDVIEDGAPLRQAVAVPDCEVCRVCCNRGLGGAAQPALGLSAVRSKPAGARQILSGVGGVL